MPDPAGALRIVLAPSAGSGIREALTWSLERFGERAAERYRCLLKQALRDIASDPQHPGSRERPELGHGIRTYHLFFSRNRVRNGSGAFRRPRHFLVYRRRGEDLIDVIRVLHDARDLERHLPEEYRDPHSNKE
ncbi:MAG: type II toxin-antitoxin system RelE/ParE family toxin [Acidobacteriales bacterium]|nr:type II toxin-antitoxin system RelE/ParE family toxin [Terriglobales bacterium]